MSGYRTFTEIVQARAAESADREAMVLLTEHGGRLRPETVTYGELDRAARTLAVRLRGHVGAGERALILQSSRRRFAVSFLACQYAGVIAVPLPPLGGRGHHDERVAGIVKDATAGCALTSSDEAGEVSRLLARTGFGNVTCLAVDTVNPAADTADESADLRLPAPDPDAVAFLQYTSGSTRDPRGAMVTHRGLLANQRAMSTALGTRPGDRIGGWLPFHHDMGLVGQLLHPLWLGGTCVVLSPGAFVKRPAHWLETVSRYRLAVSGAPDFAYDLCVRRVNDSQIAGLDLSGWRTAVDGGEPVRAETLRAFAERFAPAGLRPGALTPAYGLAEATLLVSGAAATTPVEAREVDAAALESGALREPAPGAATRTLVPCGPPAFAGLRIVDPDTCEGLPDGRVGEIWIRGESVALGYWGRPGETAEAFNGLTAEGESGFLRTGDLGAVHDGLLHVTGRIKDVIVVAGRNLYPQDLERTVQRVSALFGSGTVFAVSGERERIVVVQELRARSRYDIALGALASQVEGRITEEYEVSTGGVLFVRPGTVRRTTSGKVERAAMRRLFLRGELKPLHQRIDPEIQHLLTTGARR